jgi:hypothetical protein
MEHGIQFTYHFSVSFIDPTMCAKNIKEHTRDASSIENSIIVGNSSQAFLFVIDAQLSGAKWPRAIRRKAFVWLHFDQASFRER